MRSGWMGFRVSAAVFAIVALTVPQAGAQTFRSPEECRNFSAGITRQILDLHEAGRQCMSGGTHYADAQQCFWNNDGPYVSHGMTAYANCSNIEVKRCEKEIYRRSVDQTCGRMTAALLENMRQGDLDARNELEEIIEREGHTQSSLRSQFVAAERLRQASGRPKTLLIGTYFNAKVLEAAGQTNHGNGSAYLDIMRNVHDPYETILASVREVPFDTRKLIDDNLRALFPSYSHARHPMSDADLARLKALLKVGGKAFFARNKGISAIQKKLLSAIVDTHGSLVALSQDHWDSFRVDVARAGESYARDTRTITRLDEDYRAYVRRAMWGNESRSDNGPITRAEDFGDTSDDGADEFFSVFGSVLGAVAATAGQQSAPASRPAPAPRGGPCGRPGELVFCR